MTFRENLSNLHPSLPSLSWLSQLILILILISNLNPKCSNASLTLTLTTNPPILTPMLIDMHTGEALSRLTLTSPNPKAAMQFYT